MSRNNAKIRISPNQRVHVTLIDLSESGYRKNGGAGFAVKNPDFYLDFEASPNFAVDLSELERHDYSGDELQRLVNSLTVTRDRLGLTRGIRLIKASGVYRHLGLGSGTAVAMSCVEALLALNGFKYSLEDLIRHSRRGGTSGVGVNLYLAGGFLVDLGRKNDGKKHLRSGDQNESHFPLKLVGSLMPDWPVFIWLPSGVRPITAEGERSFFSANTPIPLVAVKDALYEVIEGIWPAIADNDIDSFSVAVAAVQRLPWKRSEISIYGEDVSGRLDFAQSLGVCAAGMSSLGPAIFLIAPDASLMKSAIKERYPFDQVMEWVLSNEGRQISYG